MNDLFLIAINLTSRCNLACAHCYMDAATRLDGAPNELSTEEVKGVLDQIASRSNETMVVLTGGEPLLRRDLEQLVEHGSRLGLSIVAGTNGVLLDRARVRSLRTAGLMGVGISIDSLEPGSHDKFRGCPGGWEKTMAGMEQCRGQGLPFQLHFSVTENNAHEVQAMIDFAQASGAHVLNIFFLVCTGRGESMSDITPARYEQVLNELVQAQAKTRDLIIRARCAPHFKRVAYQQDPQSQLTRAEGYEGGGCLAGIHYCRVTPEGEVTACPYIPTTEGNIRESKFWDIWDNSPNFDLLRNPQLGGKCGSCEFQKLCIGCRARPLAMGGTLMDADPWCAHQPSGQPIIEPLSETGSGEISWSREAEQRLSRVPGFLRKMVRKRAESYVRDLGASEVTTEHMSTLAARRFGDGFLDHRHTDSISSNEKADAPLTPQMVWTTEASNYLNQTPTFLQDGIRQVAEDVAKDEGRLEVNIKLLQRLELDADQERSMPWEPGAESRLQELLEHRPPQVRMFVAPSMEAAAEREAKARNAARVGALDVDTIEQTALAGVEWDQEAMDRVRSAPEFIRAEKKKAAESKARKEGITRITSSDLTRFRNRAMLRAVKRMKGFGMQELNFDAYQIAQQRVPRLQENTQAAQRFAEIRNYVDAKQAPDGTGLGVLDKELLETMKTELKS